MKGADLLPTILPSGLAVDLWLLPYISLWGGLPQGYSSTVWRVGWSQEALLDTYTRHLGWLICGQESGGVED